MFRPIAARTLAAASVILVTAFGVTSIADAAIEPLVLSPTSGPVGTVFNASQDITDRSSVCPGGWFIRWDDPTTDSALDTSGPPYSVSMSVPAGAAVGTHVVVSYCDPGPTAGPSLIGRATFTVTPPPTTTVPTTATTTTTSTTTTTVAKTTTTTVPPTTTTVRPATTTTSTSTPGPETTSSTTTPGSTVPDRATSTTTTVPEEPEQPDRSLTVDHPTVAPGTDVVATGRGCAPHHTVRLTLAGDDVGFTRSHNDGSFEAPVDLPVTEPGRYRLDADCGPLLDTPIDVVLATHSDVAGSTAFVALLFLLVVISLSRLRRSLVPGGRHDDR